MSVVWRECQRIGQDGIGQLVRTLMSAQCGGQLSHRSHHPHCSETARPHAFNVKFKPLMVFKVVILL